MDRGARSARRNGPVENTEVDIAGNVDNQINVNSDSSLDDELLEVFRARMGGRDYRQ